MADHNSTPNYGTTWPQITTPKAPSTAKYDPHIGLVDYNLLREILVGETQKMLPTNKRFNTPSI